MKKYGLITGTLTVAFAMMIGLASYADVNEITTDIPSNLVFDSNYETSIPVEMSENEYNNLKDTASGLTISLEGKKNVIKTVKDKTLKAKKKSKSTTKKTKVKSKKKKTKASTKKKAKKVTRESLGNFKITAYCPCAHCCGVNTGITASGTKATAGRTIAADTSVLPFGTKVQINGHTYTVEDRGGAIKSKKIDIYFDSHQEALNFGVQYLDVYLIK